MLTRFFEKRRAARQPAELAVRIRAATAGDGWVAQIAAGRSVVSDASPVGLRLSSDAAHAPGRVLRVTIPAGLTGQADAEVVGVIRWSRRNPVPVFGRYTYGLEFVPANQPGVPALMAISTPRPRFAPASPPPA